MLQKSLIIFSLIVASGLVYWSLVHEDQSIDYSQLGPQIAEIRHPINQVKIKHESDFFFSSINKKNPGFHKTQVFTEAKSQAQIVFNNSLEIMLPQNTLITLLSPLQFDKDKTIELQINKGEIQFKSLTQSTQLKIKQNDKTFVLNLAPQTSGKFNFQVQNNNAAISILTGQVKIPTEDDLTETIHSGESLRLETNSQKGQITQNIVDRYRWNAKLLEPSSNQHFDYPTRSLFRWKSDLNPGYDNLTELELSTDSEFMTIFDRYNVTGQNEFIIPFETLPNSPIFWRLRSQAENGDWIHSASSQFSYQKSPQITLGQPTKSFQERGRWKAIFEIVNSDPSARFEVQASTDPQFKTIYDQSISTTPIPVFMDESGEFYFRARRAYSPNEFSNWSNTVKDIIRPPLKTPQVIISQETLELNGLVTLHLSWGLIEFAKDYIIQFSESKNFNKFIKIESTPNLTYSLQHRFNRPGYVRVLARSKEGELSLPSESLKFKGVIHLNTFKNLTINPPLIDEKNPQAFLIAKWEQNEDIPSYELTYLHLESNEKRTLTTPNIEIKIPVSERKGTHQLSIKPIVDDSQFFTFYSKANQLSYEPPKPLITPQILTPRSNEVFLIPNSVQPSIRMSWTQSPYADWYVVELSTSSNFNSIFKTFNPNQSELILSERLKDGKWYFRVKARNIYQLSNWSLTGEFYFGS